MVEREPEQTELSATGEVLLSRLAEIAAQPDRRIFAVIDGAAHDNLPAQLRQADVAHRPLYRHAGGDYSIVVGGPWLIDPSRPAIPSPAGISDNDDGEGENESQSELSIEALEARSAVLSAQMMAALDAGDPTGGGLLGGDAQPDAITARLRRILAIGDEKAGAVFWVGDRTLTEENLHRHLRGINRIIIPRTAASDEFATGRAELAAAGDGPDENHSVGEMVIFRHADPNVMVQLFPGLDEGQAARLFGPATEIFFAPEPVWGGGIKRGRRPAGVPAPAGHLHLVDDNIHQIRALRVRTMREMRIAYLKRCCPDELDQASADALADHVLVSEQTGRKLGLVSEAAHCRWAYLMFATRGEIAHSSQVTGYIRQAGTDPDRQVDNVMKSTIAALKAQRAHPESRS